MAKLPLRESNCCPTNGGEHALMSWYNNLKLQPKLLLAFAAVLGLMGTAVFFGIRAVQSANTATGDVYNNEPVISGAMHNSRVR